MKNIIGTGVILKTRNDTYLLQERDDEAPLHPGVIACFGGGIEGDETVADCAIREMQEELDLILNKEDLILLNSYKVPKKGDLFVQMYMVEGIVKESLTLMEGKNIIEFSFEEAINHEKVTDFTKEVLKSI